MLYFILYIIIINIISFYIMKLDKYYAKKNKSRISEKTLFTLAFILGATGIFLGMYKFRHKTKHFKFTFFIPIVIVLNILSCYYIYNNILIHIM